MNISSSRDNNGGESSNHNLLKLVLAEAVQNFRFCIKNQLNFVK
jgi:hypothetical protein